MTERFVKPLTFFATIKEVALLYVHVFKHIFGIVLLASLAQAAVSLLMPENPTIGLAVSLLASVVYMFFYAWILYRADSILMNRPEGIKDALTVAKKRFLSVVGVLVVYLVLVALFFLFGFTMQYLGNLLHITFIFAAITFILSIFVLTLLTFTMPAVILDSMPVFQGLEHSVRLVWGNWWRTFGVILIYVIPVVLLSLVVLLFATRHVALLTLYEFIYHIITYPLMVSLILVLYHDLNTRYHKAGFKRVAELEEHKHNSP